MKGKVIVSAAIMGIVFVLLTTVGLAGPGGVTDSDAAKELAAVRQSTKGYHDVDAAELDGYLSTEECVAVPGVGGMGIHYVNFDLVDTSVDLLTPEVLLYAPRRNGVKLVGVEYLQIALVQTAEGAVVPWFGDELPEPPDAWATEPPVLFGRTFHGPMPGHDPGMPWHYDLHVWLWQANPLGTFEEFNPNVSCS
jgi:hypothetical protein